MSLLLGPVDNIVFVMVTLFRMVSYRLTAASRFAANFEMLVSLFMVVKLGLRLGWEPQSLSSPLGTLQHCIGHSFSHSKRHHTSRMLKKDAVWCRS